jgi:hypothetical protein
MKLNLLGLALAPTASLMLSENALAVKKNDGEPALLDLEDPQAKAMEYMCYVHLSKRKSPFLCPEAILGNSLNSF